MLVEKNIKFTNEENFEITQKTRSNQNKTSEAKDARSLMYLKS